MPFVKATKHQSKGRVALIGVSGSGKTWTSLMWARVLAGKDGRIALIDTEAGSASKYADDSHQFDTLLLESFTPKSYIAAIHEAEAAGYDVLIIDSLSHAWCGKDGVLAMVDNATARSRSGNAFTSGWREVTPEHNSLVETIVRCKLHLIVTMRAKQEFVIEEVNGKKMPKKIGMAPVQRDGLEYEFDLVGDMDTDHTLVITKSRCTKLADQVIRKPDEKPAEILRQWLTDGVAAPVPVEEPKADPERVNELKRQIAFARVGKNIVAKWLDNAKVRTLDEMKPEYIEKCIQWVIGQANKKQQDEAASGKIGDDAKSKYAAWVTHMEGVAQDVGCASAVLSRGLVAAIKHNKLTGKEWEITDALRGDWEEALRENVGFFCDPNRKMVEA